MKNKAMLLMIVVLIGAGIGCILYPDMVYLLASQKQGQVIQDYQMTTEEMNQQRMDEAYQKAVAYNEKQINPIVRDPFSENTQEESADYAEILNVNGTMGVLEIPKIKVNLPIYHGTSETVLSRGVGHLKNTALPVGGTGTHAVLTGHRGYAGARLFTDLDQLVMEDRFYLRILDKTLTYEVDQILVVTPEQTEALKPIEKQDFVTLLTCTPYQINSHRLLVRGKRVEEGPTEVKPETMEEPIPIKALLFFFVSLVGIAAGIWYLKKRKEQKNGQM